MGTDILVTGISGFVGRAVARNLAARGLTPIGLDRHPKPVEGAVLIKKGDIMDFDLVRGLVKDAAGVINLAGVLGTSELLDSIGMAIDLNIRAAENIFRACKDFDKPAVQITVGNKDWLSVYPVTKVCAEKLAQIYATDLGARIAVVRAMNAYGGWQKYRPIRKLIPNLIRWAMLREPAQIYGDGLQVLDPIYVDDVAEVLVRALLYAAEDTDTSEVFEAGTGLGWAVRDTAALVWACVNPNLPYPDPIYEPMRIGEPRNSITLGDPATLATLGLTTQVLTSFDEGLRRTVAWYRNNPSFLDLPPVDATTN